MNYPYAQIDDNIVQAVSMFCSIPNESHPYYNYLIPIREEDYTPELLGMRYIGRDADGCGLFEPVPEPEQTEPKQTEPEQTEPEQTEPEHIV